MKTEPEPTQMLELPDQVFQTATITTFYTFKKLKSRNTKKTQIKFLKMKTRMSEMKK